MHHHTRLGGHSSGWGGDIQTRRGAARLIDMDCLIQHCLPSTPVWLTHSLTGTTTPVLHHCLRLGRYSVFLMGSWVSPFCYQPHRLPTTAIPHRPRRMPAPRMRPELLRQRSSLSPLSLPAHHYAAGRIDGIMTTTVGRQSPCRRARMTVPSFLERHCCCNNAPRCISRWIQWMPAYGAAQPPLPLDAAA